jgi:hypothetical protein
LYYLRGRRGKSARIAEDTSQRRGQDVVVPETGAAENRDDGGTEA